MDEYSHASTSNQAPCPGDTTILVVDDQPENVGLLSELLKEHYKIRIATNGSSAIKATLREPYPDLILMDVTMPGMDGYEACARIKSNPETNHIAIIFLTGQNQLVEELHGFDAGAVDYISKPISPPLVLARVHAHISLVRAKRELVARSEDLERLVQQRTAQLLRVQDAMIVAMATLAETRDNETGNHIRRTQRYVEIIARELSQHPRFKHELTEANIELLLRSAPLHDIGKIGVPDNILKKTSPLTPDEFEVIKLHTTFGGDAILAVERELGEGSEFLRFAREIAYSHQEFWDGSGYPKGLAGDEIPISARLMTVADVYDALISRRCYKPAFSHEEAIATMRQGRAKQFDPDVLDAFLRIQYMAKEIASEFCDHRLASMD